MGSLTPFNVLSAGVGVTRLIYSFDRQRHTSPSTNYSGFTSNEGISSTKERRKASDENGDDPARKTVSQGKELPNDKNVATQHGITNENLDRTQRSTRRRDAKDSGADRSVEQKDETQEYSVERIVDHRGTVK